MRILIFHGYLLRGTGSNVYNARLAAALAGRGATVDLLCQDRRAGELGFVDAVGTWDGEARLEVIREPVRVTAWRPDIGDLLPVYVDDAPALPVDAKHRLSLTREGWLEPWIRLRPDEDAERKRVDAMPSFETLNPVRGIKPGATVLARALTDGGTAVPALVEQRFGQGRVGALLIGDLWRWGLRRPKEDENDMEKAWRQTVRWLVGDVPRQVEAAPLPRRGADDPDGAIAVTTNVRDKAYAPLDNATVTVRVTAPDKTTLELRADPDPREPGRSSNAATTRSRTTSPATSPRSATSRRGRGPTSRSPTTS